MNKSMGLMASLISAVIFGITSVLGRLTYDMGSNAITLTLLRALIAIPFLFVIIKCKKISLVLTRRQWIEIYLVGIFGYSATTFLLLSSYYYITVGAATVLHFLFPAIVTVFNIFYFKLKLPRVKVLALVMTMVGISFFLDGVSGNAFIGILFAIGSAITNSFYILAIEHSSLRHVHYYALSFHFSVISTLVAGLFAYATGNLSWNLNTKGWVYTTIIAILVTVGAFTLLQVGIRLSGGTTASIISTAEPITSLVVGWFLLGEVLSISGYISTALILAAVVIISAYDLVKAS